jgi:hypothetical protein
MAGRRSPAFTDQLSLDYVRQSQAMPHVCREAVRNALMFAQRPLRLKSHPAHVHRCTSARLWMRTNSTSNSGLRRISARQAHRLSRCSVAGRWWQILG